MEPRSRDPEHGGALLLAMAVLSGLAVVALLTVVTVQGGARTASAQRFTTIASYAAESGGAAAMSWLRGQCDPTVKFSAIVNPLNASPLSPAAIPGNGVLPGAAGNPFSADLQAWYRVEILNNREDSGFAAGNDTDAIVILRATGYGPDGAIAIIEWEIKADASGAPKPFTLIGWHQVM